ncbi:MAG: DUF2905 family protein [Deltaproteobacteria bacterium]|nr:DUF2905 family protein [Deltaproteobacteria bacterium]
MSELGKALIGAGLLLAAAGVVLLVLGRLPLLGRLPGDILVRRPGFTFYFPLGTSLLLSALLSLLLWWLRR